MSDPDERLSGFDPGPSINPLPPADVRRQGDRLRRRNNLLAGAGAALVVAVIVAPIAVLSAGSEGDASPDPARPVGVDWVTTIPARFPVDDGMGGDSDIPTQVGTDVVSGEQVLPAINLCGTDVWSPTDAADTLGATWSDGVEGGEQRTLALYADDATAERSLSRVAAAVEGCTPSGSAVVPARLDSDLAEQSTAWVLRYLDSGRPTGDTDVWQVARVGNALLLDKTYVPDADPVVSQQTVTLLSERAAGVVDAMCVFAAEGCATSSPSPAEPTTPPATDRGIPDDFPIDWDPVDMTGDGGEIDGPGPDARGATEVSPCDRVAWPVAGVDRLAFTTTGPEFEESRELVLFASADEAVAVMEGVRSAVAACPSEINELDPTDSPEQVWDLLDTDTGYDSAAFSLTYADGMPGGIIHQLTRVGRAIVAVDTAGEYARGNSVTYALTRLDEITSHLTPAMCAFTEAGC